MAISLFAHNQSAYDSAITMLAETGKAAIVHPTGTGKSFIGFKLCEDNPDATVCWLAPSEYIYRTQLENLEKTGAVVPDNIRFYTYAKLMLMDDKQLHEICPDFIILDEFHRCGAAMWGQGVKRLLEKYLYAPILGLSATNIRYLDNQRDMADELFDGNIASEMSLGECIVQGILTPPKYVISVYQYQKELEKYEMRIRTAKSKAVRDAAKECLEALRRALDQAVGMDEIFRQHMTDRHGKYIVFCANAAHMEEMQGKVGEWFSKIDDQPHIYCAYAQLPETSREFAAFKADDSDHLKLLFCIDMLNEGIHVEDISGVILLRPTVSPIIYKQQIGRALSAGGKNSPVIFDIVMNIDNLYSIGAIEEEMQIATTYYRVNGMEERIVNEHFRVTGEVRDCIALFRKLNETLGASWDLMYEAAMRYHETYGNLDVTKRYVTPEGFSLGAWLNTQRRVYEGKIRGYLTQDQIDRLNAIGMRWQSPLDENWDRCYQAAKKYYQEHGNLLVPTGEDRKESIPLGRWIAQLRTWRKSNIRSGYLTKERIAALDQLGMVWSVPDYLWEQNYQVARNYYQKYGDLDVRSDYVDEDGIRLGAWLAKLRGIRKGNKSFANTSLTEDQIRQLDQLGMNWGSRQAGSWQKAYEAVRQYQKQHGHLNIPSNYCTEDGIYIGRWLRRQKQKYPDQLTPDRKAKLETLKDPAFSEDYKKEDPWEKKYQLVMQYLKEHGDINIPSDYKSEGVWLARWLAEQVARLNGKPTGKNQTIKSLTPEQEQKLEALGIQKNTTRYDLTWNEQYEEAKAYYLQNGNLSMPKRYVSHGGKNTGIWVQRQRSNRKKGNLRADQIARLDEIGMVWEMKQTAGRA